jgi:hypothetical protein
MSCCFPCKKERNDLHSLASKDLTHHLQIIDIRTYKHTCHNLDTIFKQFITLRAFNNMYQNFITRPLGHLRSEHAKNKRVVSLAKRNRIKQEIAALSLLNSEHLNIS